MLVCRRLTSPARSTDWETRLLRPRAATRNLIEVGIVARPAFTRLLGNPDAEVRARARQVLNVVRETDFRLRLKAFETDTTGKLDHNLPSWDRFRREIGESARPATCS